jgi:transposase
MKKSNHFSPEVRERAVRMVQEHRGEHPSLWAAIESIAPKIGCVPQTLNEWVKRDEIDTGARAGVTTTDLQRLSWFNHHRLLEPIGYIPAAEAEANYYRHLANQAATAA